MLQIIGLVVAIVVVLLVWFNLRIRARYSKVRLVTGEKPSPQRPLVIPFKDPYAAYLKTFQDFSKIAKRDPSIIKESFDDIVHQDVNGSVAAEMIQGVFLNFHLVTIWNIDMAKEILNDKNSVLQKVDFGELTQILVGESVLNADGEKWRRQRAILSPAFRIQHLRGLLPSIYDTGRELLSHWKELENQPVSPVDWIHKLTLEVIGKTGFGHDFKALENVHSQSDKMKNYEDLMAEFRKFVNAFPRIAKLTGQNQKLKALVAKFEGWMVELIQEKREKLHNLKEGEEAPVTDILDVMVRAYDSEEGGLTDTEMIHNMNTFFIAGHETTASALSTALVFLAENPECQRQCYEEIINVAGDEDATSDQLKEMKYLDACIKETLRLNTPAVSVARMTKEDTTIGGYHFPKGTMMMVQIHTIHRNAKYWPNPTVFDPSRFLDEKDRDSFLLLPFSKGARMCIGVNFAMIELRSLLSLLLRKYEFFKEASDPVFRPALGNVLSVDPTCTVRFRPRAPLS